MKPHIEAVVIMGIRMWRCLDVRRAGSVGEAMICCFGRTPAEAFAAWEQSKAHQRGYTFPGLWGR